VALELSIIVPVFREAATIDAFLAHLKRIDGGPQAEVIVVDGDPAGSSLSAMTVPGVIGLTGPAGRGLQMNRGAARARGRILLFVHADTRLPQNALLQITSLAQSSRWAGGAFDLCIDSNRPIYRLIEQLASLRSRLTRIPYGDQAIFLRRDVFDRLGGFAEIPIMEDVELMRRVKQAGLRIQIFPIPVCTSARRWEAEGIIACTLRNWWLITRYLLGASPLRLARYYKPRR
jgi:rSAM/selenodomain-associated transferase 2